MTIQELINDMKKQAAELKKDLPTWPAYCEDDIYDRGYTNGAIDALEIYIKLAETTIQN